MSRARYAVWAVLLAACISEVTGPDRSLPEDPGTPTGAAAEPLHAFAWWPDGGALLNVSGDSMPTLERSPVPTGAPTRVDGPRGAYGDVAVGADGAVYAVADTGGGTTLLRLAADTVALTTPPAGIDVPLAGVAVLATATATYFLGAPDSVFLDDGERTPVATGCAGLVTVSADGGSLLCRAGTGYRTIDLETGGATPITLLPADAGTPLAVDWSDLAPRVFHRTGEGYAIRTVDEDSSTVVWTVAPGAAEIPDAEFAAWSPDGTRVAYWTHTCLEGDVGVCTLGQSVLRIYLPASRDERIAAVAHGERPGRYLAFSPDGTRIAYGMGGAIYTVAVP